MPYDIATPAIVNVAGNITLLNIMAEEVTVFMIENKEVADSFRDQLEKMWVQDVQVYEGHSGHELSFKSLIEKTSKKDDVIVFAAKPTTQKSSDFNLWWNKEMIKR